MSHSRARFAGLLAAALVVLTLAVPAVASAGGVSWDLRSSWISYIERNWSGGPGPDGPGWISAISPGSWSRPTITLTQPTRGSGGTAAFAGGVRSQLPDHVIDVSIERVSINFLNGNVYGSGSYIPVGGSATTYTNWHLFTLSGGIQDGGAGQLIWFDAIPLLTADGATIFNGGRYGAYRSGDAFGVLTAVGDF